MTAAAGTLYLNNRHLIRLRLTHAVTGLAVPGLSVEAFLATSPTGETPIDPALRVAVLTYEGSEYRGEIPGAALAAALGPYVGTVIYERHRTADGNYDGNFPLWVMESRPAAPI